MSNLYPTSSNVAVFLNGIHVDEAYQIQYKENSNKIPIYGYNDYRFSNIAYGRTLVQGILIVNFKFPGYLNAVLDERYTASNSNSVPGLYNFAGSEKVLEKKIETELKSELPALDTTEGRAARAEYIASLLTKDNKTREATKKALNKTFDVFSEPEQYTSLDSPLNLEPNKVTLDIYYQEPNLANWFTRFYNIHFYEVSQSASQAGAEGSSEPLYEIYSFLASHRTTRLLD